LQLFLTSLDLGAVLETYAYVEWTNGEDVIEGAPLVVLCVHGLTRNSRDFDVLAQKILEASQQRKKRCTVVCLDVVGRGKSDMLENPADYNSLKYAHDIKEFIEFLCEEKNVDQVDYIGTSMGGIIGMLLFHMGAGTRIRKFVSNDVGAVVTKESLNRIKANLGDSVSSDTKFGSFAEAVAFVRKVACSYGPLTDRQWEKMTENYVVKTDESKYKLHYDPAIFKGFQAAEKDMELWAFYNTVSSPMLLLHGLHSDLLLENTVEQMRNQGPGAKNLLQVVQFSDCGHAPALVSDEHCAPILRFIFDL